MPAPKRSAHCRALFLPLADMLARRETHHNAADAADAANAANAAANATTARDRARGGARVNIRVRAIARVRANISVRDETPYASATMDTQ